MKDVQVMLHPQGGVAFEAWSGIRFEGAELAFILDSLQPDMTFIDVGSNIGLFSLAASTKLTSGSVYAFEPCSATFNLLERNIHLNGRTNISPFRTALSDRVGTAQLKINAEGKDGLNTLGRGAHKDCDIIAEESVSTITLEDFVRSRGVAHVDIIKIDAEGSELLVLKGAGSLLAGPDAPLILYEGYSWCTAGLGYHPVEIMWLLTDLGFELYSLDPKSGATRRREPGDPYDAMMIAVKPGHRAFRTLQERLVSA